MLYAEQYAEKETEMPSPTKIVYVNNTSREFQVEGVLTRAGLELTSEWDTSVRSVEIGEGVTEVSTGTFAGLCALTSISFPASLSCVGAHSISACAALGEVKFPRTVVSAGLDYYGIYGAGTYEYGTIAPVVECPALTRLDLGGIGGTRIQFCVDGVYEGCRRLEELTCVGLSAPGYIENVPSTLRSVSVDNPAVKSLPDGYGNDGAILVDLSAHELIFLAPATKALDLRQLNAQVSAIRSWVYSD